MKIMKSEILSHFDCSDYIMGGMIEDNLMHIFGKNLRILRNFPIS